MIITIIMIIIIIIVMNITDRESRARADVTRPIAARKGGEQGGTSTRPDLAPTSFARFGKGQMGSALMGSLRISCFLTEGPFGYCQ